jgi:hypothetical protein
MKAITEMADFLGIIIIIIVVAFVAVSLFPQIFSSFFEVSCDTKKSQSMEIIIRNAQKTNSLTSVTFKLPDCVEKFKAGNNIVEKCKVPYFIGGTDCNQQMGYCLKDCDKQKTYCFKEYGKNYECIDTSISGENIIFNIPEIERGEHCFYVYGAGSLNDNPTVVYSKSGKC